MEFITQHPWRDLLLTPLTPAQQAQGINQISAQAASEWEYIDTEMAKLGTISHDTVDLVDVQTRILRLLATETKDFRLFAHLANTLQRSEQASYILLAIALLADYVDAYWGIAAPQNNKQRIAQMIIQRFTNAKEIFCGSADQQEREQSTREFVRLKQVWQSETKLCDELDKLIISYAKAPFTQRPSGVESTPAAAPASSAQAPVAVANQTTIAPLATSTASAKAFPSVMLDDSSDRAWNKTLLKIADIEAERQFTTPISFQLRRHAVWFTITTPPPASNGVTQVPPLPVEKTSDFEREFSRASYALWSKVESTISYSPYWFDGHYLSANIAEKLGHTTAAEVIRNELRYFLARFPECQSLCFSNGEPFMSDKTRKWLNPQQQHHVQNEDYSQAVTLFESEGLQAALAYLEQTASHEPRSLFYSQLQAVKLLDLAGCHKLAKQQLTQLIHQASLLSAQEWEASFFESCNGLKDILGSKES